MSKAAYNVYAAGGAVAAAVPYIEDFFATTLYNGDVRYSASPGSVKGIRTDVPLSTTASWSCTTLSNGVYNNDGYSSTTFDSSGNQYVLTTNTAKTSLLTTKINTSGGVEWTRSIAAPANVIWYPTAVIVDSSGNVYASIYKYNSSTNSSSSVLLKYNSSGSLQWQREQIRGTGSTNVFVFYDIKLNSSGDLFAVGTSTQSGTSYGIVCKYNSSGTIQWSLRLTGTEVAAYCQRCFPDGSGNVYVVVQNSTSTPAGDHLFKVDSSGSLLWQRKMVAQSSNAAYMSNVTVDSSGNVIVAGQVYGTSGGITSWMAMLLKYNSSGTLQWSKYFNVQGYSNDWNTALNGVVCDSSNNIYVSGRKYNPASSYDWVVAKYNSSGTLQWSTQLTNYYTSDTAYSIFIHPTTGKLVTFGKTTISGYSGNACWVTMPTDGTATSGYAGIHMEPISPSLVERTPSPVESAGGLTTNFGSAENGYFTDSAGSFTDTSGTSLGFSTLTQNAVTSAAGLVWIKQRTNATNHQLMDTVQGSSYSLVSNNTEAKVTDALNRISFTASGFSLGYDGTSGGTINNGTGSETYNYTAWTFRKQPKFFDIVTWTGDDSSTRQINHNLGATPAFIIIKRTDTTSDWIVAARKNNNTYSNLRLNNTNAELGSFGAYPTGSAFTSSTQLGVGWWSAAGQATLAETNATGGTYVAYLFAHDAGGFGLTGNDNVISCGSVTADGSGSATVNLGYEPQWVLIKSSSAVNNWVILDTMRGFPATGLGNFLNPNSSAAESSGGLINVNATGFYADATLSASTTYIYIAIRRGPMKVPTLGTSVFYPTTYTGNSAQSQNVGFNGDLLFIKQRQSAGDRSVFVDRPRGLRLLDGANSTAEYTPSDFGLSDSQFSSFTKSNNISNYAYIPVGDAGWNGSTNTYFNYVFRRAPGFFDIVCYSGSGSTSAVSHNLGVQPELIFYKSRTNNANWIVHTPDLISQSKFLRLNSSDAAALNSTQAYTNSGTPTSTTITPGSYQLNTSSWNYVAYLFATCPGVSKVGTYTGNGSLQTIDCGFAAGARFILIKRTDNTSYWYVFDTARGIVSGNDPFSYVNLTSTETTGYDLIDPANSGFIVNDDATYPINANGGTYIFLAIA